MRWYLLRDRRHEGPYSKEQIVEGVKAGKMDPRDYLLPEIADKDKSSFAYISVSDVVGPEVIYDLQNKSSDAPKSVKFQVNASGQTTAPPSSTMESLRSEFEEGLESTQLIQLKNEQRKFSINQVQSSNATSSFVSLPEEESGSRFPVKIIAGIAVLLIVVGFAYQPVMTLLSGVKDTPKNKTEAATAAPYAKGAPNRAKSNRLPAGNLNLPQSQRPEETAPSLSSGTKTEEVAEPISKKRRKRKSRKNESTEPVEEETDSASDAESFDEGDSVDEDDAQQEDTDEADI